MGPNDVLSKGFQPDEAIGIYTPVKLSGKENIVACDTLGEAAIGVLQEEIVAQDVTDGRHVAVRMMGISLCVATGAITRGEKLAVQADGTVDQAATTQHVIGIAMNSVTDGDWVPVFLTPGVVLD